MAQGQNLVCWHGDRNGINKFHVKITERSLIDLQVTLRPSKLGHGGSLVARNGINNFYVKVIERSSTDLPMTLGLFIEIEPSKLDQ